jgi:predicted dehydrogenase
MTPRPNRRQFLAASTLAAGGLGLAGFARGASQEPSSPNEAITLGFIGVGGMGQGLLNIFKQMPEVRVAAVCDVYEAHRLQAKESAGGKPDDVKDFREVIDRKDIDAVVVATPDHWHAIPTLLALQAEKDVYCEKPLAYRIGESRRMADAARKYRRVTQMGNLIHASETWRRVVEIVQSGVLGEIAKVRVWMAGNREGLGHPPDGPAPSGFDYETWLGPAPERPYNPNRSHFNWRYFWDYGGGFLTDFCCHIIDPVHWAMDVSYPETIAASGGRWVTDDNAETPDTLEVVYRYRTKAGDPFLLVWSQSDQNEHGPGEGGLGVAFHGSKGTLQADYNRYRITPNKGVEIVEPEPSLPRSPGHHREWLDAIKSRGVCPCNFDYGHRLSSIGHLGNIALWTGQTLAWDGEAERVTNCEEANNYLLREEYRKPWTLPEV